MTDNEATNGQYIEPFVPMVNRVLSRFRKTNIIIERKLQLRGDFLKSRVFFPKSDQSLAARPSWF
jgi:hypothetical protein